MATPGDEGNLGKADPAASVTVFSDRARCRHYAECIPTLPEVFEDRLEAGEPEEPTRPTMITLDPQTE